MTQVLGTFMKKDYMGFFDRLGVMHLREEVKKKTAERRRERILFRTE